jgi:hypothetical protein
MARSAARIRSLRSACDLAHDRAFNPRKYDLPSLPVQPAPALTAPPKSRKQWLEEHFELAVRKEFERLGKK